MANYNSAYFSEGIFATDYAYIAQTIATAYKPVSIIEFGCGTGSLSKALHTLNIKVDAIDGYSTPDLGGFDNITFTRVDLNNEAAIALHVQGKRFDVAICTEVAEHLAPASSAHLIKYLTQSAPVVIFSAAVPHQEGNGHINCSPRGEWHELFTENNFCLQDSLRGTLREHPDLAIWYKLNVVDYVWHEKQGISQQAVIKNLLNSESYSSSLYYQKNNLNLKNEAYLNKPFIKQYLQARNFLKKILK